VDYCLIEVSVLLVRHSPLRIALLLLAWLPLPVHAEDLVPFPVEVRAAMLVEADTGIPLYDFNGEEQIEPASLTKMMTLMVVFDALRAGVIHRDDKVPVSVKAWKAEGSRMFIEPNKLVTVGQLIDGVATASGNDSAIALAEYVAGSEEIFVERMNDKGKVLGLKGSHFVNVTGLPAPNHRVTAHDLATIGRALAHDYPEFYPVFADKEITYNDISQYNRNKLLWRDARVDGIKTGHTESAGYCLVTSGKEDGMRLVAVVTGAGNRSRAEGDSLRLINYGFRNFTLKTLFAAGETIRVVKVWKGERDSADAVLTQPLKVLVPREGAGQVRVEVEYLEPLIAPVAEGQQIATMRVSLEGRDLAKVPLVARATVPEAGMVGRLIDSIRLWLK